MLVVIFWVLSIVLGISGFLTVMAWLLSIDDIDKKWYKLYGKFFIPCLIIFLCFRFDGINPNHYQPQITGKVTSIYYGGNFWKTYEGYISLLGVTTDGNGHYITNTYCFTIINKEHVKILKQAQNENKRVMLELNEYYLKPFKYGSASILKSITILDD